MPGHAAIVPLVCTQRADAVAVIAAACQVAVDCRFELGTGTGALTLGTWDVFLTQDVHLMTNDETTPDPLVLYRVFSSFVLRVTLSL